MFKLVVLFAFIASAFSFVSTNVRSRSVVKMAVGDETFSKSVPFLKKPKNLDAFPEANEEFDPMGFAEYFDVKFLREAELKHCRVAMLATVGWLVQQYGPHLPSPDGIYDTANPIDAFFKVGASPIAQIFITIGALESINHNGKLGQYDMHKDVAAADVGKFSLPIYGASRLKGKSAAEVLDLKTKELRNGRLAMFAIGGLVHHTIVTGSETFGSFPNPDLWGDVIRVTPF